LIDVGLVDFIGKENNTLAMAEIDDLSYVFFRKTLSRGVSRVNDAQCTHICSLSSRVLDRGCHVIDVEGPLMAFIEVVWDRGGIEQGESGGVERILGDGNHNTSVMVLGDDLQNGLNARGCTLGQEDMFRVGRNAVSLFNELGYISADRRNALGMRVGTDTNDISKQHLSSQDRIHRIKLEQSIAVLGHKQVWIFTQRDNLAEKRDGLLIQLLWVSDITTNDPLEWKRFLLSQILRQKQERQCWPFFF